MEQAIQPHSGEGLVGLTSAAEYIYGCSAMNVRWHGQRQLDRSGAAVRVGGVGSFQAFAGQWLRGVQPQL